MPDPSSVTCAEAGISTDEQIRLALEAALQSGGTASIQQIYAAVEARLAGRQLSEQGRASLRDIVNRKAVQRGLFLPHNPQNPGWHLTDHGRALVAPTAGVFHYPLLPALAVELTGHYRDLLDEDQLLPSSRLEACYSEFRRRFAPEVLAGVDGEALLERLHGGPPDSLAYWLEFKNDEEFPAFFGSIAGGSALKFGIFRRRETGQWNTRSASNLPVEISLEAAIEIARSQRDELIRGCELLSRLPPHADDDAYRHLQQEMDSVAPEVSRLGWGHKYFSLLFPEKLDDFHAPHYQRFHLIKLLQIPPEGEGRYDCAGRFVDAARQLEMPLNHFTTMLNRRNGRPHSYWKVGTSNGQVPRNRWELMRSGNCVAIGWDEAGDLSECTTKDGVEALRGRISAAYRKTPQVVGGDVSQIRKFVAQIAEGDLVFACDGATVLGIGRVTGPYYRNAEEQFPNRRPVEWLSLEEWKLPKYEGLRLSVYELKSPENKVEAEGRILQAQPIAAPPTDPGSVSQELRSHPVPRLPGIRGRIQSVLERKGQVILYGPPGTGKTYWAEAAARDLAAYAVFGQPYAKLGEEERTWITGTAGANDGLVRLCCFHPAYGYEDFLEGYRPETVNGSITFPLRAGTFKQLCADATLRPDQPFYLLVDEINRGDIPRIFGELMTVLEKSKRGKRITLPVSGQPFQVPRNVYVIGTMNTADRSIALLDTALRRRFGFIELMPDKSVLGDTVVAGIPLGPWLEALNARICQHVGRDARNLQIGHTYFLAGEEPLRDFAQLSRVVREDVIPLLEEYCYEDYHALARILGKDLVDPDRQLIRDEVFEPGRAQDLVQALLAPCREIATSTAALKAETLEALDGPPNGEDAEEELSAIHSGDEPDEGGVAP